ncbi:hypothetical protein EYF80_042563 [Liparis tanakae]|uniref:Uncharacterized protein n=1 Tax=Liparis tanakae TaxID=230148 RepID=A0A4Z2G2E9_9TELE|nr:hypothetical protein EYF80_042563 [Liparis tanakae]
MTDESSASRILGVIGSLFPQSFVASERSRLPALASIWALAADAEVASIFSTLGQIFNLPSASVALSILSASHQTSCHSLHSITASFLDEHVSPLAGELVPSQPWQA